MGLLHGFMAKTGRAGAVSAGMAPPRKKYPLETRPKKHLSWKVPVPYARHSSPVVVGNKVFLTACNEKTKTRLPGVGLRAGNGPGNLAKRSSCCWAGEKTF